MRVLHVISGIEPESGGPTTALTDHCRGLVAAGVKTTIVATWKSESSFPLADRLRGEGIDVTLLGPTRRPFRGHPDLDATLEAALAEHDVLHVHAMWEWIEHRAPVLARAAGVPYVWTPHGMLDRFNMKRNHLFKRFCLAAYLRRDLSAAACIHAASDFEANQIGRWDLGAPSFVQGFALDAALLHGDVPRGAFRARHGLGDAPVVLFLGRIQRGKGLETLVPAMAKLTTPATLVIAGPDEASYKRSIEALIERSGMSGRVRFVGMLDRDQKTQALTDADVLAAPSAHENFGLAVAEALACGTPVVVSDQVGLANLVTAHDLGRVAPVDVSATAAALDAVLTPDPARRERCRTVARTAFDRPTVTAAWVGLYQQLSAAK